MEQISLKYCIYARKSTEAEEKQALSIDSQIKEMKQIADREGLNIVEIRRESHSAKESGQRPVFEEILKDIDDGIFNAIITWAPDRLSRNAGDLGKLVDRIDQKKLTQIKTFGQTFTNSPSDKFLLMILCSQAKLENDNKSINVKRGMRATM
jgi:site-specific DNA recombinase